MFEETESINNSTKIEKMTSVSLSVTVESSAQNNGFKNTPEHIEFIYGIGFSGITDFEYALADKKIGDEIIMHIDPNSLHKIFGHLINNISIVNKEEDIFIIKIKVLDIRKAEKNEILNAMLKTAPRGCGSADY